MMSGIGTVGLTRFAWLFTSLIRALRAVNWPTLDA